MYCKTCSTSISIFSRQKCGECNRQFCSKCMDNSFAEYKGVPKLCKRCVLLLSGSFSRNELERYTVKELRQFLSRRDIDMKNCFEKVDLIELVLQTGAPSGSGERGSEEFEHSQHIQRLLENTRRERMAEARASPSVDRPVTPPLTHRTHVTSTNPETRSPSSSFFDDGYVDSPDSVPPRHQQRSKIPRYFNPQQPPPAYETVMNHPVIQVIHPNDLDEFSYPEVPQSQESVPTVLSGEELDNLFDTIESGHVHISSSRESDYNAIEDDYIEVPPQNESTQSNAMDKAFAASPSQESMQSIITGDSPAVPPLPESMQSTDNHSATVEDLPEELLSTESAARGAESFHTDRTRGLDSNDGSPRNEIGATSATDRVPYSQADPTELSAISCHDDIQALTVLQLKLLLVRHYVDYKGCCEKRELVERVYRLWKETTRNEQLIGDKTNFDDLCKICMDAPIDCILLECGHMVTCTHCGKRMAECPVCRHYVSRVVHVFKA